MHLKNSLFIGILVTIIWSCSARTESRKATTRSKSVNFIEGIVVKPSVLDQTITVSGTLKSNEETVLMPDINGRVVAINFQEGMQVEKGTLLVQLFNDDLKAQLQKLQAQLDIAEQTVRRQNELVKINGISLEEFDQAVLEVNSVKADMEVIRAQLRKTEIVAPFDGTIGLRNISIGAVVNQATPLATIRQIDRLKIEFSFPGKYLSDVKIGTKLSFTVQGNPNKFEATVIATEEGIDAGTRNLKAKAMVNAAKGVLIPGMYANIELRLKENPKALMIPTQAIIPEERYKKVIISRAGKAEFVIVEAGVRRESDIEILSGVQAGDTVVTTGILFIKPGSVLKFAKIN
jgi:membrane fusion protein (multidrug efflux system)